MLSNFAVDYFLGAQANITLPVLATIRQIITVILLPTFLGVFIRRYFPKTAISTQKPLKWITVILLALLITFFMQSKKRNFL